MSTSEDTSSADIHTKLKEALIINTWASKCGACRMDANPRQETHVDVLGFNPHPGEGCGVRWRYVTSDYIGANVESAAKKMRPDLEWFNQWPGLKIRNERT